MTTERKNNKWLNLVKMVINSSESDEWDTAKTEWVPRRITSFDVPCQSENDYTCMCGHPHIVKLFRITNIHNGTELKPIGSECIKRFGTDNMLQAVREANRKVKANSLSSSESDTSSISSVDTIVKAVPVVVAKPVPPTNSEGSRRMTAGKHVGKTFDQMCKNKNYIEFIREKGFSAELKALVRYYDAMHQDAPALQTIKQPDTSYTGCLL